MFVKATIKQEQSQVYLNYAEREWVQETKVSQQTTLNGNRHNRLHHNRHHGNRYNNRKSV